MTATSLERVRAALAGRYRVDRELGQGGMATVYLARDERHDRQVAVKVLRADLAATLGPERFLREIRIAANLTHPHIVPLYDSGEASGFLFYVMPYIEGESLGDRVRREGRLSVSEALGILREVSDALSFAHSRGVVHRDIKPDNVILSDRHAMVADFGVAKAVSGATTTEGITGTGIAVGTPAYMAPEQVAADPDVDHRADIYALGAMAYELLAGRLPFSGPTPQAVLAGHLADTPDPLSSHCDSISRELEAAVMRCLAKDPIERWQSADQLWTALGALGVGSGARGAAPAGRDTKRHAIVVLPFTNQSPDPENEFFSDGLTEEIIADLSKVRALSVISRTSSMLLKGTDKSMRAIGRELGVRYALAGSVRKAGSTLRITAQLIDALTDEQLWAEKYSGTMDDVFDVQERVSREIVKALDVTLTSDEDKRLADRPVADVRAFELYLQARQEIRRYDAHRALKVLTQAIAIEGETPAMRALLGWAKVLRVRAGLSRDLSELDEAEALAHALLREAPEQGYGQALLGYIAYERGHQPEAVRHFRAALEREPNDADSLFYLGVALIAGGQNDQGRATADRFLESDPLSPMAWLFACIRFWFVGEAEGGLDELARALEIDPQNMIVRWCAGYTYALLSRVDEAERHAAWMKEHAAGVPYTAQLTSLLEAMQGRRAAARKILAPVDLAALDHHNTFHLAESFAMAGETEHALDLLDRAITHGFYPYAFIAEHCPFLAPLRKLPRFPEIAAKAQRLVEAFDTAA